MRKIRIAVLDSGISSDMEQAYNVVESYYLCQNASQWKMHTVLCEDYIGHGTAVAHIIYSVNKNVEFVSVRICENILDVDETGLLYALDYIYRYIDVDIINISAGITYLNDYALMEKVCHKLVKKGVFIIAAFSNDGAISFPAAISSVIGVDTQKNYYNKDDITFVKNGIVDVLVADRYYRTIWLKKKTIVKGTSFACAYITGLLSLQIEKSKGVAVDKEALLEALTTKEIKEPFSLSFLQPTFGIKKAIIFPVNKESHAILRFKKHLSFSIAGVYDEILTGKVGTAMFGETIKSYNEINWKDDFDTVILSGTLDLALATKKNYQQEIVQNAIIYGKNIYSFEDIASSYEKIFYPKLSPSMVPYGNRLKLHKTIMPVVGVFGTSSKQGKFTLQQNIIRILSKLGYNVGFLSTEPSGYLFDADYVFHFGYHANTGLQPWECISILNEMIWNTQLRGKDILITGCQSGTIHYNNECVNDFSIYQYAFLLGTLPDIYILCVNPHDDWGYIKRNIDFLNSVDEGKVCGIAVFPMKAIETVSGIGYKVEEISQEEMMRLKDGLHLEFNLPVWGMNDEEDLNHLCTVIIGEFSEK